MSTPSARHVSAAAVPLGAISPLTAESLSTDPDQSSPSIAKSAAVWTPKKIQEEIRKTQPEGVEVEKIFIFNHRKEDPHMSGYKGESRTRGIILTAMRVSVQPGCEDILKEWLATLQEQSGMPVYAEGGLSLSRAAKQQLKDIADPDGIIRSFRRVNELMRSLFGPPPEVDIESARIRDSSRQRVDLTADPAITIDPAGTPDPEDCQSAYKFPDGTIRIRFSFPDATWVVSPESEIGNYAARNTLSLYSRHRTMPIVGSALGHNDLALTKDEPRRAFTLELLIAPDGSIAQRTIYKSLVRVAAAFTFEEAEDIQRGAEHPHAATISILSEAIHRLKVKGKGGPAISPSDVIPVQRSLVQMCMTLAYAEIAKILQESGAPTTYRACRPAKQETIERIVEDLNSRNIPAIGMDFQDPRKFAALLEDLEEAGHHALARKILAVFEGKTHYLVKEGNGHEPGSLFFDFKPRTLAGIDNQTQVDRILNQEAPLSREVLERHESTLNRKLRAFNTNCRRLALYDYLAHRLKLTGLTFDSEVVSVDKDKIRLEFGPPYMKGRLLNAPEIDLTPGQKLKVTLEGFDTVHSEFVFSLRVGPVAH